MKRLLCTASLILSLVTHALAFGSQGHRTVGMVAQGRLNQKARAAVAKLLGPTGTLADIAVWPDDIKLAKKGKGPLKNDPEAKAFNKAFPDNGNWHFVNLALGTPGYTFNGPFSKNNDIVHMLNACIQILEAPKNTKTAFTKLQALRWLVHLAGDIHQPLHVACGYYQFDDTDTAHMVSDPLQAKDLPHDRGGNLLFFGSSDEDELHATWDNLLVEMVANTKNVSQLASFIAGKLNDPAFMTQNGALLNTDGNFHTWPARWATDSLMQAREAYKDIIFKKTTFDTDGDVISIKINLPNNYNNSHVGREAFQITKAGFRLAELLNRINFQL